MGGSPCRTILWACPPASPTVSATFPGKAARNLRVLTRFASDRRYMGMGNYLRRGNRSYFGLRFSYETIPNELDPFDYDAFEAYPGRAEAVVTNLETGRAEYLPRAPAGRAQFAAPGHLRHSLPLPRLITGWEPHIWTAAAPIAIPWKHAILTRAATGW